MGSSSSVSVSPENVLLDQPQKSPPKTFVVKRASPETQVRNASSTSFKPNNKRGRKTNSRLLIYEDGTRFNVEDVGHLKKEYAMFKLNTENEISNLEKFYLAPGKNLEENVSGIFQKYIDKLTE